MAIMRFCWTSSTSSLQRLPLCDRFELNLFQAERTLGGLHKQFTYQHRKFNSFNNHVLMAPQCIAIRIKCQISSILSNSMILKGIARKNHSVSMMLQTLNLIMIFNAFNFLQNPDFQVGVGGYQNFRLTILLHQLVTWNDF